MGTAVPTPMVLAPGSEDQGLPETWLGPCLSLHGPALEFDSPILMPITIVMLVMVAMPVPVVFSIPEVVPVVRSPSMIAVIGMGVIMLAGVGVIPAGVSCGILAVNPSVSSAINPW